MKKLSVLMAAFCITASLWAQQDNSAESNRVPSGVISGGTNSSPSVSRQVAGVTNTPSVDELALQLQTLRNSVEQTLPVLTEFNKASGATNALAGALSGLISGVFGRNTNASGSAGSGQRLTNVLSALGALVNTNAQGTVSIDKATLQRLAALEKDLQPVAETIRNLNLGSTNQPAAPQGTRPGGLTPTGR